jgi:hypothetical protein
MDLHHGYRRNLIEPSCSDVHAPRSSNSLRRSSRSSLRIIRYAAAETASAKARRHLHLPTLAYTCRGEWRGGVSPPRSLRTGREPLGSSGSRYPAVRIEKRPVREELWVGHDDTGEPLPRAFRLLLKALVFAAHPFSQVEVDSAQTVVQRRLVKMTVVVDPTPEVRIYLPSSLLQFSPPLRLVYSRHT